MLTRGSRAVVEETGSETWKGMELRHCYSLQILMPQLWSWGGPGKLSTSVQLKNRFEEEKADPSHTQKGLEDGKSSAKPRQNHHT